MLSCATFCGSSKTITAAKSIASIRIARTIAWSATLHRLLCLPTIRLSDARSFRALTLLVCIKLAALCCCGGLSVNSGPTMLRFAAGRRDEGAQRPKNAGQPQLAPPKTAPQPRGTSRQAVPSLRGMTTPWLDQTLGVAQRAQHIPAQNALAALLHQHCNAVNESLRVPVDQQPTKIAPSQGFQFKPHRQPPSTYMNISPSNRLTTLT